MQGTQGYRKFLKNVFADLRFEGSKQSEAATQELSFLPPCSVSGFISSDPIRLNPLSIILFQDANSHFAEDHRDEEVDSQ